jgi:hypothetical protein
MEAGNLPRWEAHRLDVVPGQHPVDAIEGCADKGKKCESGGLLRGQGDSLQSIESQSDLLVTVTVEPEIVPEELSLSYRLS